MDKSSSRNEKQVAKANCRQIVLSKPTIDQEFKADLGREKSVTIPLWVWEKLVEHYKKHREEYESQGIRSPTRLVRTWILEKALKE